MLVRLLMMTKMLMMIFTKVMLVFLLAFFYPFVSHRRLFITIGVGLEL